MYSMLLEIDQTDYSKNAYKYKCNENTEFLEGCGASTLAQARSMSST